MIKLLTTGNGEATSVYLGTVPIVVLVGGLEWSFRRSGSTGTSARGSQDRPAPAIS